MSMPMVYRIATNRNLKKLLVSKIILSRSMKIVLLSIYIAFSKQVNGFECIRKA